jgi:4-hydroxy-tetrahydrodipicolinate reductase
MLKIALSGANGKMGKAIIAAAKKDPDVVIAVKLIKTEQKINLLEELQKVDVFIDFSNPVGCENYLKICRKLKIPMVIGTTGFSIEQKQEIAKTAEEIPILFAPNMSIGANISYYLLECLSKMWSYDNHKQKIVEIKEVHHKNKKDAPSGTALKMAEVIKQNSSEDLQINFTSKRVGNVKGKHQVKFTNLYEEVIIKHKVKNRSCFAKGALFAAKSLVNKPNNLYSLSDLINY